MYDLDIETLTTCMLGLIIIYMYLPQRYFKEGFPLVVTKYYTLSDLKD